ncbi:flagellar motor switch phosphatase FliY [Alicyclobacillus cellulosilyticus]|uniref:Flagellar motor switch phosphatase FliY n=1 Tax=Alicyclobacillus cellulosilyticus TaxID=1003997 RepID=A0A917K188_9BACL|nr:flagellar motor switch phosphatase FliY [Alicyclobacillus cellulosilyticus]GGI94671.1 flagellar motor switch phosphatase FliY [Alicyclobacillus cellulosilyticus]
MEDRDAKLSQAEIDALLSGLSAASTPPTPPLSDMERDALGELGNISLGSSATSLSVLLRHRVQITTPQVSLLRAEEVRQELPRPCVLVTVRYTAGLEGENALVIDTEDAMVIADLMLGGDGTNVAGELNELHLSAVAEAMNQMMGAAATAMSTVFNRPINISPPTVEVIDFGTEVKEGFPPEAWLVNVSFRLRVGELVDSRILQLIPISVAKEMVAVLTGGEAAASAAPSSPAASAAHAGSVAAQDAAGEPHGSQAARSAADRTANVEGARGAATGGPGSAANPAGGSMAKGREEPALVVRRPEFPDFTSAAPVPEPVPRNLSLLLDVSLNVTVELGRTKRSIKDILELAPGSVLELDKLAGEPVDILVNNKRIAIGEVVVIDENFGVRITDIVSPEDRVRQLR